MKAKEVIAELKKDPDAEVWCGAWNGYADTYATVDHVYKFGYDQVSNDFFGTPGRMDKRILKGSNSDIFFIGSLFGRVPNPEIDSGDDDIDYPIQTMNDDPDLIWKMGGFRGEGKIWKKEGDGWEISYNTDNLTLDANNFRESCRFVGKVVGIETLRNIIRILKIDLRL